MKYPIILTLIVLFSCQKQEDVKPQQQTEVVDYNVPMGKPGKGNGHGQGGNPNPTPTPEPTPTPDPTPTPTPQPTTTGKIIYVDFDGEQIASSFWGYFYATPSQLTAAQRAEVLNYSNAHYAAYNVTVTDNRYIYDTTSLANKVKVVVTDSAIRPYGATGVALINSFGGLEQTAWVFSANLGNSSKWVADIVSHEAGHTLNLYHQTECVDGVVTVQYRNGVIMGSPYYTYPAVWANGTTQNCMLQNDHAILSAKLGLR